MNEKKDRRSWRDRMESGQSLVEISLGLIILVFILGGIIDIGRAYFVLIQLEDAAGESSLYLALNPDCPVDNGNPDCAGDMNGEWRARNAGGVDLDQSKLQYNVITLVPGVGGQVELELTYEFDMVTPILTQIAREVFGSATIPLSVKASQTVFTE